MCGIYVVSGPFVLLFISEPTVFRNTGKRTTKSIASARHSRVQIHNHSRHPLASHPFTNSSSENLFTATVRALVRIAKSSSGESVRTVWNASANCSEDLAWYPVGSPSRGTMMSNNGPPEA